MKGNVVIFDAIIGDNGRITIPTASRKKHGLKDGDIVTVHIIDEDKRRPSFDLDLDLRDSHMAHVKEYADDLPADPVRIRGGDQVPSMEELLAHHRALYGEDEVDACIEESERREELRRRPAVRFVDEDEITPSEDSMVKTWSRQKQQKEDLMQRPVPDALESRNRRVPSLEEIHEAQGPVDMADVKITGVSIEDIVSVANASPTRYQNIVIIEGGDEGTRFVMVNGRMTVVAGLLADVAEQVDNTDSVSVVGPCGTGYAGDTIRTLTLEDWVKKWNERPY